MKVNVCCVYWTLLFVSFISSCLLFMLVATESGIVGSAILDHETNSSTFENEISVIQLESDDSQMKQHVEETTGLESELGQTQENNNFEQQKPEDVAEIHSSFEEVVSHSSTEDQQPEDAASFAIPLEPVSDVTTELYETGQAVVFTLVDTAAAELHDRVSVSSHNTDNLNETKSENLSSGTSNGETQIIRPPLSLEEALLNREEISKNLSIPENVVDNIFQDRDQQYVVRAEPMVIQIKAGVDAEKMVDSVEETGSSDIPDITIPTNTSVKHKETVINESIEMSNTESPEQGSSEDIPSFSEWAQKQLAEAEKKKIENSTTQPSGSSSRISGNQKIRSKNYASPDCGAKIVGTNPEAMYAGSIISPSRDEYVLNACSNRFWFVVELCEAIQAKKIELANFELFSSSPRDFSVSISDRFPSRDWRNVGYFTANDERDVQSFNLDPHLFGKFVKVELHSHYGSEHYCPISLFRVYGTSEFEVLETEVEVHESVPNMADDDDDEEPLDADTGEPPKTLFGSAQDAVMSIVKKAAQVLVKSGDSENDTVPNIVVDSSGGITSESRHCVSPSHIVVCDNCSDAMFNQVFELLSCRGTHLQLLIDSPFVSRSFHTSKLCAKYGLDFSSHRIGAPYPLKQFANGLDPLQSDQSNYLSALLPPKYIAALCNLLAILEKKVVFNISYVVNSTATINHTNNEDEKTSKLDSNFESLVITHPSTCTLDSSIKCQYCTSSVSESSKVVDFSTSSLPLDFSEKETTIASQIKPTKTLVKEAGKNDVPSAVPSKTSHEQGKETKSRLAETVSAHEHPTSVTTSTTVIVTADGENLSGTSETEKGIEEDQIKNVVSGNGHLKGEISDEIPSLSETNQLQQAGVNDKQSDVIFEEKYQETQDGLSLDSLLSDLKDLDMGMDISSSASNPSLSTTTVSPPSLTQTQVQKESVFVRLSNRIKALERNMSLSGQYLEELSRRYKKQVEEMQKLFNRTLVAVGEESRKGEERELRHVEEMAALHKQLATLTFAVEMLLAERDSWQHKAAVIVQHVILIVIEVVVFGIILYFCRRLPDTDIDSGQRKWSLGWRTDKNKSKDSKTAGKRRRSVEGVSGHKVPKVHRRRPSEEALNISGTYSDLLIESHVTEIDGSIGTVPKAENRRKRRKRKDGLHKSSSSVNLSSRTDNRRISDHASCSSSRSENDNIPARRASSSEIGKWNFSNGVTPDDDGLVHQPSLVTGHNNVNTNNDDQEIASNGSNSSSTSGDTSERGKENMDSPQGNDSPENIRSKQKLGVNTSILRQGNGTIRHVGLNPKIRRLSSPFFMKTAMSARNTRVGNSMEPSPQARLKSDNWEWYSSRRPNVSLDKSSQITSPIPSQVTLHNGSGYSSNNQHGTEFLDRTNETEDSQSAEVSQKDSVKKIGSGSGLKKMVKKFF